MYPPQPQPPMPAPPPVQPRKRHHLRSVLITAGCAVVAFFVALVAVGAVVGGSHKPSNQAGVSSAVTPYTPSPGVPSSSAPPPAPAPSPAGTISGSCDVSLSDSLYGQNYLTAQVQAQNTGNIGTVVRIRVSWPLQGFAPITKTKTVRLHPGSSSQAEFHMPVTSDQVSNFQDAQMAALNNSDNAGAPCHYHAEIIRTFGQATG